MSEQQGGPEERASVSEEQFVHWLDEAAGKPTRKQLDQILDHHTEYVALMGPLVEKETGLWQRLSLRAEERCIHLKRPLMHRRRAHYTPVPDPHPPIKQTIAGYPVLYPLHKGSLGSKTLVAAHPDGFLCLLKQYRPEEVDLDPRVMFRHQERMIQRLNQVPDPRLEEVLDHFLMEDGLYIQVKPFLRCNTLKHWMGLHPGRDKRIRLLQSIGHVLQVLHQNEVAHMDLKPEQVLVLPDPETGAFSDPPDFVLIDYDFSMVDGELTLSVGSAPYYAPEQFERHAPKGHLAGVRADTYAFSVFMHRLLAETFPFGDGRTEPTLLDEMKTKRILTSLSIPHKPLRKVLQAGLHPKPSKRPSFDEILEALEDPSLVEQSHLFPTTRRILPSSGLEAGSALLERLSFRARVSVAASFVGLLGVVGFVLHDHGTLSRIPPVLLSLFLLGCLAFLVLLFMRDDG
jgi:serine/threonine protein kinase